MAKRNRNGEGTIGKCGGRWWGGVSLPNGKRKAVYGSSFDEDRENLTALQRDLAAGPLAATRGDRLEWLVTLALATGLRLGELLGLGWKDITPDCSALTVRNALHRDVA